MVNINVAALAVIGAAVSAYALFSGCSGPSESTLEPNDSGVEQRITFEPAGCGYTVRRTELHEFQSFELHADVASTDPQIRFVRRGLGGAVEHGQAGYADPARTFTVGWQTDTATLATRIRFGESPDQLAKTAEGFSFIVLRQGTVGPAEGIRFHEVHVCGLEPGRTYHYQVGGGAPGSEVWSPMYSLTTAPASSSTDAVQLGLSGDSRDALGRDELVVWRAVAARFRSAGYRWCCSRGTCLR